MEIAKDKNQENYINDLSEIISKIIAQHHNLPLVVDDGFTSRDIDISEMHLNELIAEKKFSSLEELKGDLDLICNQFYFIEPHYTVASPGAKIKSDKLEEFKRIQAEINEHHEKAKTIIEKLADLCEQR